MALDTYLIILVERGQRFRELTKWCSRFKINCINRFVATTDDRGIANTLTFIAERHRANVLFLEKSDSGIGLAAMESRDLGKVFGDLLNRVLKYYSILIPLPTYAGYPITLFPSDKHLNRFMEIEIPAIRSYASIYLSGIYRPVRIRDVKTIESIIRMFTRNRHIQLLMRRMRIEESDIYTPFSNVLQSYGAS